MFETRRYLVIWQIGDNKYQKHETPVDLTVRFSDNAEEIYVAICNKVSELENVDIDLINILAICKL